ncbi:hypothetical protein LBMAG56_25460 [Verrucomicrobiota bacterium]|nr:hypothetical protein LBMAG56_25460 [Verrucomicrobiota bacterium]
MNSRLILCLVTASLLSFALVAAQSAPAPAPATNAPSEAFLQFVKARAAELRSADAAPATLGDWNRQRAELRANLLKAWGGFPAEPCALNPKKLGELQREGYRVEKLIFQTRPNVWMTANAYVPDRPGKLPTVLCVHGHWRGAKQDPVVQSRCIGLAKLGFFVLVVDAFGAGERGVGKALGEYHGEMTAATLFPVGLPLSGLQVYENMRAVDYLLTRPEVDGARLGITGASGGGNQSMYAGAFDERFKAVVPVCSVGNYQAYLGAACCMCEVVPGALRFTEEWGLLSLVAPRALMVVSATKDAFQFSVGEAKKSLALTEKVFQSHGYPDNVRHAIFESPHAYNQPMREAMYGWMTKHLKGEGDGSPVPEPAFKTEDPETLRCYPGDTRPDDWMTIPKFAATTGRALLAGRATANSAATWEEQSRTARSILETQVLGLNLSDRELPESSDSSVFRSQGAGGNQPGQGLAILLDFQGEEIAAASPLAKALLDARFQVLAVRLRSTGAESNPRDAIGRAPDHNTAEWSLWLGRPLLAQWTQQIRSGLTRQLKASPATAQPVTIVGNGPAGVVALGAAALDARITRVVTVGTLASYLTDVPYEGQRLGIMAPGIVRDVGDIQHLAALIAPRRLIVAGPVSGGGKLLTEREAQKEFAFTQATYHLFGRNTEFTVTTSTNLTDLLRELK